MHDGRDELSRFRHVCVAAFIVSSRRAVAYSPTLAETGHTHQPCMDLNAAGQPGAPM